MKKILILLLNFSSLSIYAQTQGISLSPSRPQAGQKITISYSGKLAKEGTVMTHIFCYDENYRRPTRIVETQLIDNKLVGSFTLPDSVSFFNIQVKNKKEMDNNDGKGYGFNVFQDDMPKKGTFFSQGFSMFFYDWDFEGEVDTTNAIKLMQKEYAINPDMEIKTMPFYIYCLSTIPDRKWEVISLAKKYFDEILKTGFYEKHATRYTYYIANGKHHVADSLNSIVATKYPNGITDFTIKLSHLKKYSYSQPDSAIQIYKQVKNHSPGLSLYHQRLLTIELLTAYAKKFDFANVDSTYKEYLKMDKTHENTTLIADNFNEIAWSSVENHKNLGQAKVIIEKSIAIYKQADSKSSYYGNALDTYAAVLAKLGDTKGAVLNQRAAASLFDGRHLKINQQLIKYMTDNKEFAEARTKAEAFISENGPNAVIDSVYRAAYIGSTGNEKGFEEAYARLQEKSDLKYNEALKTKIINIDAPDFELKDLDGKKVKLSDFRGSIVILDFWATWCGPCIKSFPAMKKAMQELKDRPVKFLFIDTMEGDDSSKKTGKIRKTLESKNVTDFHVVLDEMKGINYEVKTAYNITGIPAKIVIDNKGKIRYKNDGFYSDEDLIRELKTVVRLISE